MALKNKSKKLLVIVFIIISVLILLKFAKFPFSITLGSNLVNNPGFEDANQNDTSIPESWWGVYADSNHKLNWDISSYSGNKSIMMEVINSTKSWYRWQGDNITVEPDTFYLVEYYYKSENLPPSTSTPSYDRAMFEWSEYDGINPNRTTTKSLSINWTAGNTGWTYKKAYLKTGLTTITISPRFFLYSTSGRIWYDDLYIRKATEIVEPINYEDYYWSGIKGVAVHSVSDFAGLQDLGIKMIRDDMGWSSIETTKGVYNFANKDLYIQNLVNARIDPLIIIDYSNCLYNSMPSGQGYSCGVYIPTNATEFEHFKKAFGNYTYEVVNHYKGILKYFEIWNEPNGFWEPRNNSVNIRVTQYIELLKEAYTRAKEANPKAVILSAGLGTTTDLINDYVRNYYTQGAKDYFDILAIHPYCGYDQTMPYSEQGATCGTIENIATIRSIMDSNGDANKKIWITEFGYPTEGCYISSLGIVSTCPYNLSEENQNIRIRNIFPTLRDRFPSVTAFFWYDYKDDCKYRNRYVAGCPSNPQDNSTITPQCPVWYECRFGLVRYDLSKKPAYETYKLLSPYQCTEDKCAGEEFYQCVSNIYINQGQVNGKCGFVSSSESSGGGGVGSTGLNANYVVYSTNNNNENKEVYVQEENKNDYIKLIFVIILIMSVAFVIVKISERRRRR